MNNIASVSIRMDRELLRALKVRAAMNDRSANGEFIAILREALKTEKAPGSRQASPDASE